MVRPIPTYSLILGLIISTLVACPSQALSNATNSDSKRKTPPAMAEEKPKFPIGNKFSRGFQKYTGINFVTELIGNQVIKYSVKKQVGGKVKVRLKTYSLTDLIAGKVKSLDIEMKKPEFEGVSLGNVAIATRHPAWFSYKRQNRSNLKDTVLLEVEGNVMQKDITSALSSEKVISSMRGLKLDLPGLGEQQLDILSPEVSIEEKQLVIKGTLITKGAAKETGVPIKIVGEPKLIGNQKIVVTNLKVDSDAIVEPEKFAKFVSDLINPVVDFGRYDTTTHAFRLNSFKIVDNEITGNGELLLVPPKPPETAIKSDNQTKL